MTTIERKPLRTWTSSIGPGGAIADCQGVVFPDDPNYEREYRAACRRVDAGAPPSYATDDDIERHKSLQAYRQARGAHEADIARRGKKRAQIQEAHRRPEPLPGTTIDLPGSPPVAGAERLRGSLSAWLTHVGPTIEDVQAEQAANAVIGGSTPPIDGAPSRRYPQTLSGHESASRAGETVGGSLSPVCVGGR